MAIWLVIGVPLAVFLIGVVHGLRERPAPSVHVWTDVELAALREEKYARERRRQKQAEAASSLN